MGKGKFSAANAVKTERMKKDFLMYNWFLNKEVADIECDFALLNFSKDKDGEVIYRFGKPINLEDQLILRKENINTNKLSKDDYSQYVRHFGNFEFINKDKDWEEKSNLIIGTDNYDSYFYLKEPFTRTITISNEDGSIHINTNATSSIDYGYKYNPGEIQLHISSEFKLGYKSEDNYIIKSYDLEKMFKISEDDINNNSNFQIITVLHTYVNTIPPVVILFNVDFKDIEKFATPKYLREMVYDYLIGYYDEGERKSNINYTVLFDSRNETFDTKKLEVAANRVTIKGEAEVMADNISNYYKDSYLEIAGDTYIYSNPVTGINAVYKKDFPTNAVITNDNFPYITDLKLIAEDENPINEFEYYTVESNEDNHVLSSCHISKMITTFFDNYIPLDRQYKETIYASLSEENIKKNKSYIAKLSDDKFDFVVAAQVRFGITFNESTPHRLLMDIFITNNTDRYDVLLYVYDTACQQPSYYFARMHKSMVFVPSDLKPVLYTGYDAFTEDDKLSLKNLYTCTTNIGLFDYNRGAVKNIAPFNDINATLNLITNIDGDDDLDTRKILEFTRDHCSIIKNEFGDILLAYEFGVLYPFNEDFFEFPVEKVELSFEE